MISDAQIIAAVAEALQVPAASLTPATELQSLPDFDSVRFLSLIVVLADTGVVLKPNQASTLRTVANVLALPRG